MTRRRLLPIAIGVILLGFLVWGVNRGLERLVVPTADPPATTEPATAATGHITATLYYGSEDGQALVPFRREVPLAEGIVAQGGQILEAQLQPAPDPYVSLIPKGTTLRAFYVTERGDAFVDLSRELSSAHPGGSFTELLTIYAIVHAVTANLPAVQRVQILVDGKEVDTIAGHVDVRRPLTPDMSLVRGNEAQ
jgi:spore germination protein GerM